MNNLAGLSAGLTCFILIMIFVQYELSYERFFDKAERIYRIFQEIHPDDGSPDIEMATNSPQVAPRMMAEFPQVEQAARLRPWLAPVSLEDAEGGFADALLADHAIFEIFDFVWLRGSPEGALVEPDTVVLTATAARRYFGDSDPLGQSLLLEDSFPMRVVGVTASNTIPTQRVAAGYDLNYEGGAETRGMPLMLVDFGYFETYGISPMTGRVFSEEYGQDRRRPFSPDTPQTSGTYIVNELAAAQLGWTPDEAIGKWIEVTCCNFGRGLVVGVVENVRYGSPRTAAGPVFYAIPPEVGHVVTGETRLGLRQAAIRISGRRVRDTLPSPISKRVGKESGRTSRFPCASWKRISTGYTRMKSGRGT